MSKKMFSFASAALLAIVFTGCAGPERTYDPPESKIRQGVNHRTDHSGEPAQQPSSGTGGDGVVGAPRLGLGSLIGAGTGRDVAMVAGAIGGAIGRQRSPEEPRAADRWPADHRAHTKRGARRSDPTARSVFPSGPACLPAGQRRKYPRGTAVGPEHRSDPRVTGGAAPGPSPARRCRPVSAARRSPPLPQRPPPPSSFRPSAPPAAR